MIGPSGRGSLRGAGAEARTRCGAKSRQTGRGGFGSGSNPRRSLLAGAYHGAGQG